jgi:hypothetical protein
LSQFLHAFLPTCFVISYALPLRSHHVFLVGLLTKELVLIWIDSLSNPKGVGDEHALWKHFFFFLKKINEYVTILFILTIRCLEIQAFTACSQNQPQHWLIIHW